jgi:BirA family biotin operon repressor/biotin-[acetyl-CoA-carboxylase] ligase
MGRSWVAEPGAALLLSVIHDDREQGATDRLVIGSCCAVAETVERAGGRSVQIRWPNDVLLDGAKLAGSLVERRGGAAVIGIGLNVSGAPDQLPAEAEGEGTGERATSLAAHGIGMDRLRLLDALLDRLDATLRRAEDGALHEAWRARSSLLGRRVTVRADERRLTGRVVELDPKQGLMIQVDGGAVVTLPAETTSLLSG